MGKPTGFKEYKQEHAKSRPVSERIHDFKEIYEEFPEERVKIQTARCMDCGIPFCQIGCPLGNIIPDFNELVYKNLWREAYDRLSSTNNFPEFTGRLCPAPCEEACVLGIISSPVSIEQIEKSIIEHAFDSGWVKPRLPKNRTGKRVAIIGSGPAGLACAQQLNSAGHSVVVYERDPKIGGLLRYGIPDFKLEKTILDRRLTILEREGIQFKTNAHVGKNIDIKELKNYHAIVLCLGSPNPNYLSIPGRELQGIHFAMDYLSQQNRLIDGFELAETEEVISAENKNVIVIGGGDTGSDCVGTAIRQKAKSVTNFELLPKPPTGRPASQPWPYWPMRLRTSSSHKEGCAREWSILSKEFFGAKGKITGLRTVNIEFFPGQKRDLRQWKELPATEKEWDADLILLALGFSGNEPEGVHKQLKVKLDHRNNVKTDNNFETNISGIFAAGDSRRGQSLIVWAISEGREAARAVDEYLMTRSFLPTKGNQEELI